MVDSKKGASGRIAKFKVRGHSKLPYAVNSFMIANSFGALCGGNICMFFPWDEIDVIGSLRYPAVFKSKRLANIHIDNDSAYLNRVVKNLREINA